MLDITWELYQGNPLTFDGTQIPKNPENWLIHLDNVQLKVFQKEGSLLLIGTKVKCSCDKLIRANNPQRKNKKIDKKCEQVKRRLKC